MQTLRSVPQTNPRMSYLAYKEEIDAAVARVMDSGWYILGQEVAAFEREFAAYVGIGHAIGVANGTDALHLALRACGIGLGDEVITVSHTAVATVAAIELCGATPVLVDIDPRTFTIDPTRLECAIMACLDRQPSIDSRHLKAVVVVHLYGYPADMPAILEITQRYGLLVIEDCAQSHGALLHERKTGSWGDIASFSFYPTKNLGALGDGGAVVTHNPRLAEQVRLLAQYGWRARYVSEVPGINSRLDEVQAAILRVKLRYLDEANARRRELAQEYTTQLAMTGLELPRSTPGATHVYHQYVVRTPHRDSLQLYMRARKIGTLVHYPVPIHLQPAYLGRLGKSGLLPVSEQATREVLSLPMYPQLSFEEIEAVTAAILEWEGNK